MESYKDRERWYALYLCIVKKYNADEALRLMGINR